jgi:alpha-amylase/alpha-mannosidase (GH57 family)
MRQAMDKEARPPTFELALSQNRYVCIHGHWYQPPRENPFTGVVGDQPSAAPFANWNERITAECYAPNAQAEILGKEGAVRARHNNYAWVSSDWGPTLLEWLEEHAGDTYERIVAADKISVEHFEGHGTAVAHTFNHTILPLSNRRDKRTQILWGLADFQHRFGREPEGMWLPETAVDLESLELMAGAGIKWTILSPYQAAATLDRGEWSDVIGGTVDPRVPYTVQLFGARTISVFFYNGPLSQEVAFNRILEDGSILAKRLIQALGEPNGEAHLSHVATDGETYGHHHRHGEMALARAIEDLRADPDVSLTNYSEFLAKHPPTRIARIIEGTSWSCAHGVERWRSDCGCSSDQHPDWNQQWRAPLRESLDYLRDELIEVFESLGATVLEDPWAARDDYIEVLLGESTDGFLDGHCRPGVGEEQRRLALDLLEIQHRAMLMYTSCGWFFDDISGLEAVFVLRQAGRVIDLTRRAMGTDLEPGFLEILGKGQSNIDGKTGRDVFEETVVPFMRSTSDSFSRA